MDTVQQSCEIPEGLSKLISSLSLEAKGLLSIMHALRAGGNSKGVEFYKISAARFKRVASELTHRYDTMSHFVPADVLSSEAEKNGCKWDEQERKLVVNA